MFKKIISTLLCPIMLLPIFPSVSASAEKAAEKQPILGKWIWGSTIADLGPDGAEILMSRCASEGITDVYLLVKGTGGKLGYLRTQYKDILTRSDRDVLQETIDAAHKRNIRVHAWICGVRDETYKASHNDAGMWQYIRGRDNITINPYDEGYLTYVGNVARELAAYEIDGLHFDYIRYNHNANGWSEKDFENLAAMGANIDRVKELVETTWGYNGRTANSNYIFSAYRNGDPDAVIIAQYRRNNVNSFAKYVIEQARSVNPNLIFSAATMPDGAYDSYTADLHYGQNYSDMAEIFDYICPMAYSGSYGKGEAWVAEVAKGAVDKGNRVVVGIQVFENVTSSKIMAEMENIRKLMQDSKYGDNVLGAMFFRSGTFEYAKATYDTVNKIITVKLENTGTGNYIKVRVEGKNGVKFTAAAIGEGIDPDTTATVASSGSNVTFKENGLLRGGKSGYLYLKYEGEIDQSKLPVIVRIYRSSELLIYTAVCDSNDSIADMGKPEFPEPEVTTAEVTEIETTDPSSCVGATEPIPAEATVEQTEPSDQSDSKKPSYVLPIAIAAAVAAVGVGVAVLLKRKKKTK